MPDTLKEIICVRCPVGCNLTVSQSNNDEDVNITGHQCEAGVIYAKEELTNPTRNIATSVRVRGGDMEMLSVKTQRPIPKRLIMDVVAAVHKVKAVAPVYIGDVVLPNVCNLGVDIVATRHVQKNSPPWRGGA